MYQNEQLFTSCELGKAQTLTPSVTESFISSWLYKWQIKSEQVLLLFHNNEWSFVIREEKWNQNLTPYLSCWTQIGPTFENSVDPDQLASEEANWSGSALFVIENVNLFINNLDQVIWLAEN